MTLEVRQRNSRALDLVVWLLYRHVVGVRLGSWLLAYCGFHVETRVDGGRWRRLGTLRFKDIVS